MPLSKLIRYDGSVSPKLEFARVLFPFSAACSGFSLVTRLVCRSWQSSQQLSERSQAPHRTKMASLLGAKRSSLEGGRALDKVSVEALLARVAAAFGDCAIIAGFLNDPTPVLLPKL